MKYYFAPMEGLTDRIYRDIHARFFPGLDRYYTPFFSPTMHHSLTNKEARELPMAVETPVCTIPQILTKSAEDFLWMANLCAERGYTEVNLNAGCPSGTVTAKGKGAGMLANTEELDRFLEQVFTSSPLPVSVKTRIGVQSSEEWPAILEVYNRYPIKELTVHSRVRKAFYAGTVEEDCFRYAVEHSKNPLCYNGDLNTKEDIDRVQKDYPEVEAVMIGRGLIARPDMLSTDKADSQKLIAFYDALLEAYLIAFGGSRNAMFRLKEHWHYLLPCFADSEKLGKKLRKTTDLQEYRTISREILSLPRI
jgi:tRNA-dihydrouridine synthase